MNPEPKRTYSLTTLQQVATSLMAALVLLTFVGTNMQALLWQSSDWLVSTVLPAVVVELTNQERADQAAAPLQRNALLDQAARQKAQHMAANEYFAHFAPDGTTPWSFFKESGYVYAHAGENLAIHFTDSTEVVEAWMDSPAHRQNIVDTKYTEIGVGTAKGAFDGYDTVYVVQLFGTPAKSPTAQAVPEKPPASNDVPAPVTVAELPAQDPETSAADLASLQARIEAVGDLVEGLSDTAVDQDVVAPLAITDAATATAQKPLVPAGSTQPEQPDSTVVRSPEVMVVSEPHAVVVSSKLATSSGLAVATFIEPTPAHAGATVAAIATQPNVLLDGIYTGVLGVIIVLLVASLLGEAKRWHVAQMVYSIALLLVLGGLWYVHTLLTSGAVVA